MEYKKAGKNGPELSALGLGCMGMSDFYGSRSSRDGDREESIQTIHMALAEGVNFLNTGDFYGIGHNELLIREALKGVSRKPVISVKFGALRSPSGEFLGYDGRPAAVKNFAAHSLTRLGVEVIDIYQPARVDPEVPIEDTVGAIKDLIQEGKVRYLGLSEASPEMIRRAHKVHPVTALEIEYSLATRIVERELLPTIRELGIGMVSYGVLARGLLSGMDPSRMTPEDFRARSPRFQGKNLEANQKHVTLLQNFAREKGCTPAQLAIAWVLHQGKDVIPLMGTRNRTRLKENLDALKIQLSADELSALSEAFPPGTFQGERYPEQQMHLVVK